MAHHNLGSSRAIPRRLGSFTSKSKKYHEDCFTKLKFGRSSIGFTCHLHSLHHCEVERQMEAVESKKDRHHYQFHRRSHLSSYFVPLLDWVLHIKMSHPLLKGLNLGAFFSLKSEGAEGSNEHEFL
jgi:hypothetical protein